MIITSNVFQVFGVSEDPYPQGGVAGGKSIHGKGEPSNMVAEGSYDPSTQLQLQPLRQDDGGDDDLQFMAASRPMEGKELETYIKDVCLVGEDSGTAFEKPTASSHFRNGSKSTGDVQHYAYSASANSGKWRYNGNVRPGYAQQPKSTNLPSLAGTAKASRNDSPYWRSHSGLYGNRTRRNKNQQHDGAVMMNSHCEEPRQPRIVNKRSRKKGRTWGMMTYYDDGSKMWESYRYQTSSKNTHKSKLDKMRKHTFLKILDKAMDDLGADYNVTPTDLAPRNYMRGSAYINAIKLERKKLQLLLRIKIQAMELIRMRSTNEQYTFEEYEEMTDAMYSQAMHNSEATQSSIRMVGPRAQCWQSLQCA